MFELSSIGLIQLNLLTQYAVQCKPLIATIDSTALGHELGPNAGLRVSLNRTPCRRPHSEKGAEGTNSRIFDYHI